MLERLIDCIDKGKNLVVETQKQVATYVEKIQKVDESLDPASDGWVQRKRSFSTLQRELSVDEDAICQEMGRVMASFKPGLFVGGGRADLPRDNLDLERWFRIPKSHERRIHGHRHAGIRIVLEGPTLVHVLDAHQGHPEPFTPEDLLPYRNAESPPCQAEALHRRKTMRKARSKKNQAKHFLALPNNSASKATSMVASRR